MNRKTKNRYFFRVLIVLLIFGGTTILLDILVNYPPFQRYLIHQLSQASRYDLKTGNIRIGYLGGLGIHADDFKARSKHSPHRIEADGVDLSFRYGELLKGRFVPARISIRNAHILLGPSGGKSASGISDRVPDFTTLVAPLFTNLERIELINAAVVGPRRDYGLKNLNLLIESSGDEGRHKEIHAGGILFVAEDRAPFRLEGVIENPSGTGDKPVVEMGLKLTDVPLVRIPWPDEVRFQDGRASADLKLSGSVGEGLGVTGQVTAGALRFAVVKKGRFKDYDLSRADMTFQGRLGLKGGRIEKLTLVTPEARVALTLALDWPAAEPIRMDLDISSRSMPLAVFKRVFPTPLVPAWIEARLFPLFRGGAARLDRFRLKGTIDQIKELERPENNTALEMRLALAGLTALSESPARAVTDLNGEVAIDRGRLLITGVNGAFGGSHLRQGTMTWPDLYGESDAFVLGIRGDFLLEDLSRLGQHPLLPQGIRYQLERFTAIRGEVAADIDILFPDPRSLPALSGRLEFKNSRIFHETFPLALDLESGRFDFEAKGPIRLTGTGRWGGSAFAVTGTTGRLWDANGKIPQPRLDLSVKADLQLADLLRIRRMSILPVELRDAFAGIKTISGKVESKFEVRRPAPSSSIRVTGIFSTVDASLAHARIKLPLVFCQAQLVITGEEENRFSAAGAWGQSSFSIEGTVAGALSSVRAALSMEADINQIVGRLYPRAKALIHLEKPVPTTVFIGKIDNHWSFQGEADLDDNVIGLSAVTLAPAGTGNRLAFDADYNPSAGMVLKTCRFTGKTSDLTISEDLIPRLGGKRVFEIVSAPLDLADLGLRITGRGATKSRLVRGTLHCRVKAELAFDQPEETRVNGDLTLKGILFGEDAASIPFNADLRFWDRSVDILSLTIPLEDGTGILKGRLTGWHRWQGRLNLTTDTLDLPRLIRQLRRSQPGPSRADPAGGKLILTLLSKSDLFLEMSARQVLWEGINLGNLQAATAYRHDRFRVETAVIRAPDGLIKLSGTFPGTKNKGVSVRTYIKLDRKPLDAILRGLDIQTDRINGATSLEGEVILEGRNKAEIIRNLSGKFNIQMQEGEVRKSNLIIKVLDFLSIQNIFQKRPPDILKDHFYYNSIEGSVIIENGMLETNRLFMKSPVFNAAAQGQFDLVRNRLNMHLGVQPLNTIDSIVSRIPIIGYILTGKHKTILVYYLKVRGSPENLVVKQVPFKNLDRAIAGYFKRLFLTPVRLWNKIFGNMEEIDKEVLSDTGLPFEPDPSSVGP